MQMKGLFILTHGDVQQGVRTPWHSGPGEPHAVHAQSHWEGRPSIFQRWLPCQMPHPAMSALSSTSLAESPCCTTSAARLSWTGANGIRRLPQPAFREAQRGVHVAEPWCCSLPGQDPAQVTLEVPTCSSRLQGVLAHAADSSNFAGIMATEANMLS